ncbi:MAG: DUF262 domain-containing protein [Zetaproteobacteria bacterium]|nr:DUF262 domain-containing protein [Zetaproteobacteria bacterium]
MSKDDVHELSIGEWFKKEVRYVIPLYQRNYAWGKPEIEQLLSDIWDYAKKANKPKTPYYLGSLVVAQRPNDAFEVIDGQQRHTTLSILLAALKAKGANIEDFPENTNLSFECREKASSSLQTLFSDKENGSKKSQNISGSIQRAFSVCESYLGSEKIDVNSFAQYLLSYVKILRVVVPKETDLNHYFEIMNNRGEQLEKHEVLKARFMNTLDEPKDRTTFAVIWDACADMDRYVQMGFEPGVRKQLFGDSWNEFPQDKCCAWSRPAQLLAPQEADSNSGQTDKEKTPNSSMLDTFLQGDGLIGEDDGETGREHSERFSSIIDFPNFLMHVLRIYSNKPVRLDDKPVPLDDKQLLSEEGFGQNLVDAKPFAMTLLKCRFLFDQHIIKRDHKESRDGNWSIKKPKKYQKNQDYVNTFTNSEEANEPTDEHKKLLMIQSMFHVSYSPQNYKYWLNAALDYLYRQDEPINAGSFVQFLEKLSDHYFFDLFALSDKNASYDAVLQKVRLFNEYASVVSIPSVPKLLEMFTYEQGIHHFIFNRLDYLLWKNECGNQTDGFGLTKDVCEKFKFVFRSSIEHWSPQHPAGGEKVKEWVHQFGNLCLLNQGENSSLSNDGPLQKQLHYSKQSSESKSLKHQIMMSLTQTEGGWSDEKMEAHQTSMLTLLCKVDSQ